MTTKNEVTFSRYICPVEIRFTNEKECCEWCNFSFRNRKSHIECFITHEEMASPGDSIGFYCPLRNEEKQE